MPPLGFRRTHVGSVALVTPHREWVNLTPVPVTNSTAIPARSAKADVVGLDGPVEDLAAGRVVFEAEGGSVLLLKFYGGDANNETVLNSLLWLWDPIAQRPNRDACQWSAYLAAVFDLTLGAKTGVTGGIIPAVDTDGAGSMLWADTITIDEDGGLPTLGVRVMGRRIAGTLTSDDSPQIMALDLVGHQRFEIEMSTDGGTAQRVGVCAKVISPQ